MSTTTLIAFLVTLAIVVFVFTERRKTLKLQNKCKAAFDNVFGRLAPLPTYEMTNLYGYPAFIIKFRSNAELYLAKEQGLTAAFTSVIAKVCEGMGPKSRPFDATLATHFTSEEQIEEILARAKRSS
jgi:7-keto-8-aminopelargonate synthetase-like enzyme